MNISSASLNQSTPEVPIESLAANGHLSESQKIAVASQQFEALLLKQILAETQKPVIQSEFTDNSTAAGIYQDMISTQLSNCLSKSDAIGLAKTFERQLNRQTGSASDKLDNDDTTAKSAGAGNPVKNTLTNHSTAFDNHQ